MWNGPLLAALCIAVAALSVTPAAAQQLDFGSIGSEPFAELPGVKLPEDNAPQNSVSCVQKYVEPQLGQSWRMERQTYYSCNEGSLTFESNQAPVSRERSMRGLGW